MPGVESAGKFCNACGDDVSGKPRTKDTRGRYYCKPCYAAAAQRSRAAAPPSAPPRTPAPVLAASTDDDDLLSGLSGGAAIASLSAVMQACPGCSAGIAADAVLCTNCGFDFRTGKKTQMKISQQTVETRARARFSFGGGAAANPLLIWGGILALFAVAFVMATNSPDLRMATATMFRVYTFIVGIWIIVCAFREDSLTGVLTLVIPFYGLYFVFAKSGDSHLRAATGISILAIIGVVILIFMEAGNA